jgi:hypothetical protein
VIPQLSRTAEGFLARESSSAVGDISKNVWKNAIPAELWSKSRAQCGDLNKPEGRFHHRKFLGRARLVKKLTVNL